MRYTKSGSAYFPTDERSYQNIVPVLPPGNYLIKQSKSGALYFDEIDNFSIENKIYGNPLSRVDRILNTYKQRDTSTGVLLTGEKGSGKTLLAKLISIKGAELGYPTIVVNNAWCGDEFNQLLQNIKQPCIFFFDEFEKVYPDQHQENILTLLDGVFPTKKLFIFTCNDYARINSHLQNRPGRIFYNIKYSGLEADFVKEYCLDKLENKEHINDVMKVFYMFDAFNFDILQALVEEMNRYKETAQEAMLLLNAKTHSWSSSNYNVEVLYKSVPLQKDAVYPGILNHSPLAYLNGFQVTVTMPQKTDANHVSSPVSSPVSSHSSSIDKLEEMLNAETTKAKKKKAVEKVLIINDDTKKFVSPEDGSISYKIDKDFMVRCSKTSRVKDYNEYMGSLD